MDKEFLPHLVTFKTAKLLKEKGFTVKVDRLFCYKTDYTVLGSKKDPLKLYDSLKNQCGGNVDWNSFTPKTETEYYSCPEHWQVLDWLRLEHNIHIIVAPRFHSNQSLYYCSESINPFKCSIEDLNQSLFKGIFTLFDTPEEAIEFEIQQVLKNL